MFMKYMKLFEAIFNDKYMDLIRRTEEYKNYIGKFCILEYRDDEIYLVKLIDIDETDYYAKVDFYDDDNFEIESTEATAISNFMVIDSFDTLDEAIKELKMILNSKKYNL